MVITVVLSVVINLVITTPADCYLFLSPKIPFPRPLLHISYFFLRFLFYYFIKARMKKYGKESILILILLSFV